MPIHVIGPWCGTNTRTSMRLRKRPLGKSYLTDSRAWVALVTMKKEQKIHCGVIFHNARVVDLPQASSS